MRTYLFVILCINKLFNSIKWMDGQMDGWMNGWMDVWIDERMDIYPYIDGWMDRQMDIYVLQYLPSIIN